MSHQAFIEKAVEGVLFNEILEFLRCIICRETTHTPIIVATCCESIIGCQQCVKTWIDSGKNTCPKCREEGFNCATINLRGLDNFLGKIHIWLIKSLLTVTEWVHRWLWTIEHACTNSKQFHSSNRSIYTFIAHLIVLLLWSYMSWLQNKNLCHRRLQSCAKHQFPVDVITVIKSSFSFTYHF